MAETIQTYWPYLLAGLAVVLALGWFLFVATRKTSVVTDRRDVLDEGAAPAQRNQALIDAPHSAAGPATAELLKSQPLAAGDDLTRIKGLGPKIATMLN